MTDAAVNRQGRFYTMIRVMDLEKSLKFYSNNSA